MGNNFNLPEPIALSIAMDVARGLYYLHYKGMSFDHLCMENVWIFGKGDSISARLLRTFMCCVVLCCVVLCCVVLLCVLRCDLIQSL